jgi:hypothetical protein
MDDFHVVPGLGQQVRQRRQKNGVAAKMHRREECRLQAKTHEEVSVSLGDD